VSESADTDSLPMDVFNRADPACVLNVVHGAMQSAFVDASKARPELFSMDEYALGQKLRAEHKTPSVTDNRLRLGFWLEYERAISRNKAMLMQNVYAGVCGASYFYREYIASPTRVAWLLCPPADYQVKLREARDFGIDLLRSFLDMPVLDLETGKPNTKLMELQAKIVSMLDQRLEGGYVQRQETKQLNLNVSTSQGAVGKVTTELSMEQLERRLKEIEKLERKAQNVIVDQSEDS